MKEQPVSNINNAKNMILEGKETEILLTKNGRAVCVLRDFNSDQKIKKSEEKLSKIKNELMPVLEYAAEIYNRGSASSEIPTDTIPRLNSVLKMFGG